jgi:hypothetical protein
VRTALAEDRNESSQDIQIAIEPERRNYRAALAVEAASSIDQFQAGKYENGFAPANAVGRNISWYNSWFEVGG